MGGWAELYDLRPCDWWPRGPLVALKHAGPWSRDLVPLWVGDLCPMTYGLWLMARGPITYGLWPYGRGPVV